MAGEAPSAGAVPWWREPTRDQWMAWIAAWLGWTLDAFDFTMFLLIMVPIAKTFGVSLTAATAVFTITLWLRLAGAVGSGWLADRVGRRGPLMIAIGWYSVCNLIAGLAPTFWLLFLFRALLGIGMGAEWPAGAAPSMETWPARSRGLTSGILQGATASGFCYHQGAIWAGFVAPVMAAIAATQPAGFAIPMLVGTVGAAIVFIIALLLGPETKGKILVAQLGVA